MTRRPEAQKNPTLAQVVDALEDDYDSSFDGIEIGLAMPDGDDEWADRPTPDDEAIQAVFPTRSNRHDLYREAQRLVGARHGKFALLAMVNWLLHRIEQAEQRRAAASPSEPVLCDACGKDLDAESTAAAENARCHRTLGCSRERDHGGDCTPMANQPGDPTIRHVVAWMRQTYPQNQHAREWANEIERVFLRGAAATPVHPNKPRPIAEWHEDMGPMLWWRFPVVEPPYAGDPREEGFPDYVTHWTRFDVPEEP